MASLSSYGGRLSGFGNAGGNANLTDAGAWSGDVGYLKSVVVSHGGALYINKIQPNFNVTPGTDASKWEPIPATAGSYPVLIGTFSPPAGIVGEAYSYDLAPLFAGSDLVFSQTSGTALSSVGLELVGSIIQGDEGDPTFGTLIDLVISASNEYGTASTSPADLTIDSLEFLGTITSVTTIRPGESFTITGTSLTGATSVSYAGISCTDVVVVNDTTITATAPASGFLFNEYYILEVL